NSKGGVGKTTLAVNLAWEAALAGYRTLLWEIDEQGDSNWLLTHDTRLVRNYANGVISQPSHLHQFITPTKHANLSLLAADSEIRHMENLFAMLAREQRFTRLIAELEAQYDIIIFDCPPRFCDMIRKLLLAVHLVVVPVIPSPLAMRGFLRVQAFIATHRGFHPPLLPVFSMVDKRRKMHRAATSEHPDWPCIPMSSHIEQLSHDGIPISVYASNSESALAMHMLWCGIKIKLMKMIVLRLRETANSNLQSSENNQKKKLKRPWMVRNIQHVTVSKTAPLDDALLIVKGIT
ncbi:MAG: ParA family protein, partial [Alphaproteobacteria bacterium]|nr:ParA family protein [Alphaproteobacteria bacterium]